MKNIKAYFKPGTVAEAVRCFRGQPGKGQYLGGGTRVVPARDPSLEFLVDLTYCGLKEIQEEHGRIRIGACTTLAEVSQSPLLKGVASGILAEVACWTGSLQLRNSTTVGGGIVSGAEIVLPLLALDAQVVIVGDAERMMPLAEFYQAGNGLRRGEVITACVIPGALRETTGRVLRFSQTRQDVALVAVAFAVLQNQGICHTVRLAVTPVMTGMVRVPQAEALLEGQRLTPELIEQVAHTVIQHVQPRDDYRASAAYRREIMQVYVKRTLSTL